MAKVDVLTGERRVEGWWWWVMMALKFRVRSREIKVGDRDSSDELFIPQIIRTV